MGCFFPPIFKKNTYKKVRFFLISAFILIVALSFSGCKAIKWVGEKIGGNEGAEASEKPSDGLSGLENDGSGHAVAGGEGVINFDPLVMWAIILVGIALIVRFLFKKYVAQRSEE